MNELAGGLLHEKVDGKTQRKTHILLVSPVPLSGVPVGYTSRMWCRQRADAERSSCDERSTWAVQDVGIFFAHRKQESVTLLSLDFSILSAFDV